MLPRRPVNDNSSRRDQAPSVRRGAVARPAEKLNTRRPFIETRTIAARDSAMAALTPQVRTRGMIGGLAIVAYGLASAVYGYYRDLDSMDFATMAAAPDYAVLHVVLFGLAGLGVIAWFRFAR